MLFFAACSMLFYAQSVDYAKNEYFSIQREWDAIEYITPDSVYSFSYEGETWREYPRESFHLDENGYYYFDDYVLVPGIAWVKFDLKRALYKNSGYAESLGFFYNGFYKAKYASDTALSENTKDSVIVYKAENLGKFAFAGTDHYESLSWNFNQKPWVEGREGYGEGETLSMSTEKPFNELIILNGYIDIQRPDLYKKNSRVKVFTVKDTDNNQEYTFELEDRVEFQRFYLRQQTRNIKLTIKEVYKGSKWEDTCVTALIPDSRTYSEENIPLRQKYAYAISEDEAAKAIEKFKAEYKEYAPINTGK